MVGKDREVELKFNLDGVRVDDVLGWLGQGRRPTSETLVSRYFDTPDLALRDAGLSLRVREEGGAVLQTVKSGTASRGRLGRGEWSTQITGPGPDLAAARRTAARRGLKDVETLAQVFSVSVERLVLELRSPDSLIEAALDRGLVSAGGRSSTFVELELELKSGPADALFALARRLQLTFPLVLSAVTKADRGFALAVGADMTLAPRRFRRTELTADMSAGQAFAVAARAAVEQIVWNATLVSKAPSPEAIHQTRVGVRRLRATLSTFKDVVSDDERRRLATRLKALGRDLDEARNLDVFIDGVWRRTPAALRPDADETALIDAKSAAYGRARTAMENGDARTLTLDVLAWIETGPWTYARASGAKTRDRPVTRFAEGSLRRGRRKLLEAGGSLATLTPAARHHVRIRTKVLRYACEVLAPVFPKHPGRASRFLLALETLAETLGDLNDLATARTVVSQLPASITLPADGGHREGKLIAAAEKAFRRLEAARPFWPDET